MLKKTLTVLFLVCLFSSPLAYAQEGVTGTGAAAADTSANAAKLYLEAADSIVNTLSEQNIGLVQVIESNLQNLPPASLANQDKIREILEKIKPDIDTFIEASKIEKCDFGLDYSKAHNMDTPHYTPIEKLTLNALAVAKLYQYEDKNAKAVDIYKALIRLAKHMNSDRMIFSDLIAASVILKTGQEVEGFLSRHPDAELLQELIDGLKSVEEPVIDSPVTLMHEARQLHRWFTGLQPPRIDAVRNFFKSNQAGMVLDKLEEKSEKEQEAVITQWLDTYLEKMKMFSGIISNPYYQALPRFQEAINTLDAQSQTDAEDNKLPNLFLASSFNTTTHALNAKAQASQMMNYILLMTGVEKYYAENGRYPETLDMIAPIIGTIPTDRFSGQPYRYEKREDTAAVYGNIPEHFQGFQHIAGMDLKRRQAYDATVMR